MHVSLLFLKPCVCALILEYQHQVAVVPVMMCVCNQPYIINRNIYILLATDLFLIYIVIDVSLPVQGSPHHPMVPLDARG